MQQITAYKLSDGSIHESEKDALRQLEKLEEPHAEYALRLLRECDGKQVNFMVLLSKRAFLQNVARLFDLMNEREIIAKE